MNPARLIRIPRWIRTEGAALVAVAFAATLFAEWRTITDPNVFPVDSTVHTYWMFRFDDPDLFRGDPLTSGRAAQVPPALLLLYWLGSLAVSPVTISELLPLVVAPLTVWLVFRITRSVAAWRPAAWIAALLYLFAWEVHGFSGGHARAFAVTIVLGAVLLLLHGRDRAAAAVAPVGALLYPPAAVTALAVVGLAWFRWRRWPPLDGRRVILLGASAILVAGAVLVPRYVARLDEQAPPALSRAERQRLPESGPHGQRRFHSPSLVQFLKQNRSGFDLKRSGSILVVAAALFLLLRPRTFLLFPRELLVVPIGSLALFVLAHLLLPLLYLPHRYTYPLVPWACVVIAVAIRPTFEALRSRTRPAWLVPVAGVLLASAAVVLALTLFPLGPTWGTERLGRFLVGARPHVAAAIVVAAALLAVRFGRTRALPRASVIGATMAGSILIGSVAAAGELRVTANPCPHPAALRYLSTVPKESVIAGDPFDVECVPIVAKRSVVISKKLYRVSARDRMREVVVAYYGPSLPALLDLRRRYSADYLVVNRKTLLSEHLPRAWKRMAPFNGYARRLKAAGRPPAALQLPPACRTFTSGAVSVFDLACVDASGEATAGGG